MSFKVIIVGPSAGCALQEMRLTAARTSRPAATLGNHTCSGPVEVRTAVIHVHRREEWYAHLIHSNTANPLAQRMQIPFPVQSCASLPQACACCASFSAIFLLAAKIISSFCFFNAAARLILSALHVFFFFCSSSLGTGSFPLPPTRDWSP